MAKVDNLKVSIEATAHNAIKETCQKLMDQFGIQIKRADIEWIDVSTTSEPAAIVRMVDLETTKSY